MSELTTAARPYARAAYAVAATGDKQRWTDALSVLAQAIDLSEVRDLVSDLRYPPAQVADAMRAMLDEHNLCDDKIWNFIRILAANRRLVLIPEIAVLFEQFAMEEDHVARAEVVSAMPLEEAEQAQMQEAISKRIGCAAKVTWSVDEALLGGAVVRIGDQVIDGSIRARIKEFKAALTA